jgi:Cu/Ag efflux protein CusF
MNLVHKLWWTLLALPFFTGCSGSPTTGDGDYELKKGTVVTVDPANKRVTLDHEDIPGLMKAMENMPFQVEDAKLLDGLKPGDSVQGRVKKSDSGAPIITRLEKR